MANDGKQDIMTLDISKVKDVLKMNIKPNHLLLEVVNVSKSGLIIPGTAPSINNRITVLKVGESVNAKFVNVGDIVVDMLYGGAEYLVHGDRKFILCDVYNVLIAVSGDNWKE